ncbi:sensor histidine kinase [Chryseobacterium proteolyticum]|uniref:sensor histidine kinase n=1 Tax=Chryseobacterium proteolyticum TaxID=118127 RepID=UPI003982F285
MEKIIYVDRPVNTIRHFQIYKKLSDSIQTSRNDYTNKFAFIKYENTKVKAEKAEKENQLLTLSLVLATFVAVFIVVVLLYKKRQKQLEQEKELEVKNTQLKLSKKVHDVVANGIYQVMTKIENQESFSKDEALDELEFVYEKSRDISYEKTDLTNNAKNFNEKISELIGSFNNDTVKTYLAGNNANIWKGLQESTLTEVYQIVRELLVNMKKHSRADRVVFRFERENELIKIYYTDNGIGIPGNIIYKNGLSSTVSRIETIKGEIIFDTKTERGLKINISFPVS